MRTNGSRSVRHGESAIAAMTMACSKVCFAGRSCRSVDLRLVVGHLFNSRVSSSQGSSEVSGPNHLNDALS